MSVPTRPSELSTEQQYVTEVFDRLDELRESAVRQLRETVRADTSDTDQGIRERQHLSARLAGRAASLTAAERGLVIGRLDTDADERIYLGRTGIADPDGEPMLIDWRAPVAAAFYRATPTERLGIRRRRQLQLRGRQVVGIDDDVLDFSRLGEDDQLTGEAALLNALRQARTGRMADIVSTIQAEQDVIIRSGLGGVLVVDGGPGTGKTVVALHRAAYLLYTHRDRLADKGILVLGPNRTFLSYVEQVLPGLGETDVVLSAVGDLYPGVRTAAVEPADAAMIKGDRRMIKLCQELVADRQRVPATDLTIMVDRDVHTVDSALARTVRDRGRERMVQVQLTHNRVRPFVVMVLLDTLVERELDRLDQALSEVEVPDLIADEVDTDLRQLLDPVGMRAALAGSAAFAHAVDQIWPELTPEELLAQLFADPELRDRVGAEFTDSEREALSRHDLSRDDLARDGESDQGWSVSDVPLLDELAELLGPAQERIEAADRARRLAARLAEDEGRALDLAADEAAELALEYADEDYGAIRIEGAEVVERYYDDRVVEPLAVRARRDRDWAYGHVIIDEAQELSPMAWRLVARRCPTGSMTAVGDLAQASAPDSPRDWATALEPIAPGRWRQERLSVSYRSTGPILALAGRVLAAASSTAVAPTAARPDGDEPWSVRTDDLDHELAARVVAEREALGAGILAVITTAARVEHCRELIKVEIGEVAAAADDLEAPVTVLTPSQAKGLEFDGVIVVAPEEIVAEAGRGFADLYVAVTRPTRRLGLLSLAAFSL